MKKIAIIILLLFFLLVFINFFFEVSSIVGVNMEPTIRHGQTVIFKKYFLSAATPKRGDIVLYYPQNTKIKYVGRVIGLPTESIRIENGNLYLDNNVRRYRVEEEYLSQGERTTAYQEGEWFKIGEFEYSIVGDKRDDKPINIQTSPIHRDNIKGKLFIKF